MYIFTKQIHIANVYIYYISTTLYQEKSRNFRPQDPLFHIVSKCQKDLKNGHRLFTLVQWHRFSPKEEQNLPQSVSLQWVKSCFMFSLIHYISSLPLLNHTSVRDHLLGLRPRLTRSWLKCINAPWSVLCSGAQVNILPEKSIFSPVNEKIVIKFPLFTFRSGKFSKIAIFWEKFV